MSTFRITCLSRAFLLLILSLVGTVAFAQSKRVEGIIVDKETQEPIPFASIGLLGTTRGASSNLNGEFSLSVDGFFSIRVSSLGYETLQVDSLSPDEKVRVQLKPSATQLQEVVIFNKKVNAKKIVKKAFNAIPDNYNTKPFVEKFFYRHYCKDDSVYGRLIEASVDVWKKRGYKGPQKAAGEKEEMRVTQLRRSFDKTASAQGHVPIAINSVLQADIAGYQTANPSAHLSFFSDVSNLKTDMDKYAFTFEGTTTYDGKEVYEIAYEIAKDSVLTTSGYMTMPQSMGTLFITTKEYAFIKANDIKFWGQDTINTTSYYTPYNGNYYPYHFIREGKSVARNNSTHWFHVELMASEILTDSYQEFYGKEPGKYDLLHIPYDSTFWNNNTTLKTTPLEDEIIDDLGNGVPLSEQFLQYQQYELHRIESGNGDEKFFALKEQSKGKKTLYVGFWSGECVTCIQEIGYARKLLKEYKDSITYVFLSLDDNEERWKKTREKYNLNADGIIHYRIGSKSNAALAYQLNQIPRYVLIDKNGNDYNTNAKHPGDAELKKEFDLLLQQE